MAESTAPRTAGPVRTPALEFARAGFQYADEPAPALTDIDLELQPGELLAVLGPQGAGTSTLCRLAAGLLGERGSVSGHISRRGTAAMLGDDPEAQLTGMTSYVDDEVGLPVRLAGSTRRVDAEAALAAFGVERLAGRRLDALSGGERQLVALASLMTLAPSVLVLDQPALSLDPSARRLLREALARFRAGGGAVLLTGHQFDELSAAADRLAFLDHGRLRGVWKPADLDAREIAAHGVWNALELADPALLRAPLSAPAPDTERDPERDPAPDPAPRPAGEADTPRTALNVHDFGVARAGIVVFDGFDLAVAPGEVRAVVGANGAGKSTLLRGIAGLLERGARVSGSVHVAVGASAERRLDGLPAAQRAECLGWVGQDPGAQLSAPTAITELERAAPLPPHRRRDRSRVRAERATRAAALLDHVGLADCATDHPYDLTPDQRKDLVIASALLRDPAVLLLDEPTLGRDLAGMRRLERIIAEFTAAGGAVVLTTHDLRWATRVASAVQRLGDGVSRAVPEDSSVEAGGSESRGSRGSHAS